MRLAPLALAVLLLIPAACRTSPDSASPVPDLSPAAGDRTPALSPDDPLYDRCEGTAYPNACAQDDDCKVGGCSGEVCSAQADVNTTCEVVPWPPDGTACGCVEGGCVWYR